MKLNINGVAHETSAAPFTPLVEVIRDLGLKGTKLAVRAASAARVRSFWQIGSLRLPASSRSRGRTECRDHRECRHPIPHPLQRIMHEMGAFQCGFVRLAWSCH